MKERFVVFFDTFALLCKNKGVSPNKACIDIGLSRTAVAKWKKGGAPNGSTVSKIAEYFNVTADYLLGKEKSPSNEELELQLDGVDFALFGETKDLTEAQKQDLIDYIKFKKSQGGWKNDPDRTLRHS